MFALSSFLLAGCLSQPAPVRHFEELLSTKTKEQGSLGSDLKIAQIARLDAVDRIPFLLKDQCSKQICGEPNQTEDPSDIINGPIKASIESDQLLEELKPELNKIFDLRIEADRKDMVRLQERRAQFASLQLSANYKVFFNFIWLSSQLEKLSPFIQGAQAGDYKFSTQKFNKAHPTMSKVEQGFLQQFAIDLLNSEENQSIEVITSLGFKEYLKIHYVDLKLANAQIQFANQLIESFEFLGKSFPELNIKVPNELRLLKTGAELSPEITRESNRALMTSYLVRQLSQENNIFEKREIDIKSIVSSADLHLTAEKILAKLGNPQDLNVARETGLKTCRTTLARSILAAPTNLEIQATQRQLPTVKNAVLKIVEKLSTDPEVQSILSHRIQAIHFIFPTDRLEIKSSYKLAVHKESISLQERELKTNALSDEALLMMLYNFDLNPPSDYSDTISNMCEIFSPKKMSDSSIDQLSDINVSWQSIRFPSLGVGVIAHELGHVVSHVFSKLAEEKKQPYLLLRSCENGRHDTQEILTANQFNEEDFADTLAARAVQELQTQNLKGNNFGCALLGKNSSRWGTEQGLSLKLAAESKDVHSAGLYRVLQIQMNMGQELPPVCKSLIETYQPNAQKQCMN